MPSSRNEAKSIIALSGKLQQTFDLLRQIRKREEKVIIFCINKRLQNFLSIACQQVFKTSDPTPIVNGDTKAITKQKGVPTRRKILKDFEAKDGFGVIIMSPIAAGTGLTVVGANNVIHLERHWNPAKEAQATDRVYRIGQKKEVNVYLPILAHPSEEITSFDENLDKLLQQKIALKDAVITPEDVQPEEMGEGVFGGDFGGDSLDTPITLETVDRLEWEQFEAFSAELISRVYGGEAHLTPNNDYGADVVIMGDENILVQCKFTGSGVLKGREPISQIYSARPAYERALGQEFPRLVLITNAKSLDRRTKEAASYSNVDTLMRNDIRKMLKKVSITQKELLRRLNKERLQI